MSIEPTTVSTFKISDLSFGSVEQRSYDIAGVTKETKTVKITYNSGSKKRLITVSRSGRIISVYPSKTGNDKPAIYLTCEDSEFKDLISAYENELLKVAIDNSELWYDSELTEEECREYQESMIIHNSKYDNDSLSCPISKKAVIKNLITAEVKQLDNSTFEQDLVKGMKVDVAIELMHVKLNNDKYKTVANITQINIIGFDDSKMSMPSINCSSFDIDKIGVTEPEKHKMGKKFCKITYNENTVRFTLTDIKARFIKPRQEGQGSYQFAVSLLNKDDVNMFTEISNKVKEHLMSESKKDKKKYGKTSVIINKIFKDFPQVSSDPSKDYPPSLWIKVYYSDEKGFENRIINTITNKPVKSIDEFTDAQYNVTSITFYSRHVWFGDSISTNFTMDSCDVEFEESETLNLDSKLLDGGVMNQTENTSGNDSDNDSDAGQSVDVSDSDEDDEN
tara:strand:+ start:304 stop:1653 length:1350 start_codon:yes stop_codon:yes gene_type:complete